jgi:hypothetical protein
MKRRTFITLLSGMAFGKAFAITQPKAILIWRESCRH